MNIGLIISLLSSTLRLGTPIALAALGELVTEKSGVVNIGIEGIMIIGAFFSVVATYITNNPVVGVLVGIIVGILFGALHGLLSVYLYADQIITGIGVTILGYGLTNVGNAIIWGQPGFSVGVSTIPSIIIRVDGNVFSLSPITTLTLFLAILLHFILKYTWIGLRLKSAGEDPEAADVAGINVFKLRTLASIFGGALAGFSGAYLGVDWSGRFISYMSAGRGYIALASVIIGGWTPLATTLISYVFGFFDALQLILAQIYGRQIAPQMFQIIPYIVTSIIFVFFFRKSKPPASIAKPYKRE